MNAVSTSTAERRAVLMEIDGLCRTFGGVRAVENVSFRVYEGEILAVIGPNGAGKTTLFNMVAGEIPPTSGSIRFRSHPLHRLPAHRIARLGIGRTFQTLRLFGNLNAWENVMVGRHPRSRCGMLSGGLRLPASRREEKAIRAAALEAMNRLGVADRPERPLAELTFREQRLLEIARAVATEPRLLLLDEPAAGLNIAETEDLGERIRRLRDEGITILIVEHDMSLVMNISDRVIVLNSGRIIAEGTPKEIQRNPAVTEAYLGRPGDPIDASRAER